MNDHYQLMRVCAVFQQYFVSRGPAREDVRRRLVSEAPELILRAALIGFRELGNFDRLDDVGVLLGQAGRRSLLALQEISSSPEAGQECFVGLVAHAEFLTDDERGAMLKSLAMGGRAETRDELVSVSDYVSPALGRSILRYVVASF
jgi:hypothetical protein